MSQVVEGKFACDQCGKRYGWKPQFAGKKAKCGCGATIVVPSAETEPDPLYELVEQAAAEAARAPVTVVPAAVAAAPPVRPTLPYRSAPSVEERKRARLSVER